MPKAPKSRPKSNKPSATSNALWHMLIVTSELLNDVVVAGHRKGLASSARRVHQLALEAKALAQAILISRRELR